MKIFGAPVLWLEIVGVNVLTIEGMIRGLQCPLLWLIGKEPQGQVLQHLLLCSYMASGSAALEHCEEVIFIKGDGGSLIRTSSSVNDINGSIDSLNSFMHAVNWYGWPAQGSQAFLAQNCKALV